MALWQFLGQSWWHRAALSLNDIHFLTYRLLPCLILLLNIIAISVAITFSRNSNQPLQWSSVMIFVGFWAFLMTALTAGWIILHCRRRWREARFYEDQDFVRCMMDKKAPKEMTPSWRSPRDLVDFYGDPRRQRVWDVMEQEGLPAERDYLPYRAELEGDVQQSWQGPGPMSQYMLRRAQQGASKFSRHHRELAEACPIYIDKPLPPPPVHIREKSAISSLGTGSVRSRPRTPEPSATGEAFAGDSEAQVFLPSPEPSPKLHLEHDKLKRMPPEILTQTGAARWVSGSKTSVSSIPTPFTPTPDAQGSAKWMLRTMSAQVKVAA
jgi:hypothetical protein